MNKISEIYGHNNVEQQLLADFTKNRLAGAYLFSGIKGIGKFSTALRFAAFLLSEKEREDLDSGGLFGDAIPVIHTSLNIDEKLPTVQKIISNSHSDLMILAPSRGKKSKVISVDDARNIGGFLSLTASQTNRRIIIIDAADNLNIASANSILKWLEEPPKDAIFLLICHNSRKILPTIYSRCRLISFNPLNDKDFVKIMSNASDILRFLSGGSLGIAEEMKLAKAEDFFNDFLHILRNSPNIPISPTIKSPDISVVSHIILQILAEIIFQKSGIEAKINNPIITHLANISSLEWLFKKWEYLLKLFDDARNFHLDTKQVIAESIRKIGNIE